MMGGKHASVQHLSMYTLHQDPIPGRILTWTSKPTNDLSKLPPELLVQIADSLVFEDLCSLRLVSKETGALVLEGAVVRHWTHFKLSALQKDLYPPPEYLTFHYLLKQQRRIHSVRTLAASLTDYIEHKIMRYTFVYEVDNFCPVWKRLCNNMIPLLLTIEHYLASIRLSVLKRCSEQEQQQQQQGRGERYCMHDDSEIVRSYELKHLLGSHQTWLFLSWVFNQLLKPPSYAGPVERAVRGWYLDPIRPHDFTRLLVLGNLGSIQLLLRLKDYKERRRAIESALEELDPERNANFGRSWAALGLEAREIPSQVTASNAIKLKLLPGEVWVESARNLLIEQHLLDPESDTDIGTPVQTMNFLTYLAGYEILHRRPPVFEHERGEPTTSKAADM